jgi:hypothetical protein
MKSAVPDMSSGAARFVLATPLIQHHTYCPQFVSALDHNIHIVTGFVLSQGVRVGIQTPDLDISELHDDIS